MLSLAVESSSLTVQGCSAPSATVNLAKGPTPVQLHLNPAVGRAGTTVLLGVSSPEADSIVVSSADGLDRYAAKGSVLRASLAPDFGDSLAQTRYAVRHDGRLFDVLKKPVTVLVCRQHDCQSYYHELAIQLPERNRRSVAITGGWSASFDRRAVQKTHRDPRLGGGARSRTEFNLQAEVAAAGLSARMEVAFASSERMATLDLSRALKQGTGVGYGLAFHFAAITADWHPTDGNAALGSGTAYRGSVGPAVMLKGITISSQIGLYGNGRGLMQELTTFLSFNGALTDVRIPLTVTVDRMIAFGDQSLQAEGEEQLERLTLAWEVLPDLALRLRMATRRGIWSNGQPAGELRANEVRYTVGAQYTVGW